MPITSGSAIAGFAFGLSLIVAIGAQNAFVLRQGLQRRHVGAVVAVCAVSDVVLIAVGVAGVGAALTSHPTLTSIGYWAGGLFLLAYAAIAFKRALRPAALTPNGSAPDGSAYSGSTPNASTADGPAPDCPAPDSSAAGTSTGGIVAVGTAAAGTLVPTILTALALTWLNPHVYLDTVVLLGSIASAQDSDVWFGIGAAAASIVWFSALGFGARYLRPLFARARAWQVLDAAIGVLMLLLAFGLLQHAVNS